MLNTLNFFVDGYRLFLEGRIGISTGVAIANKLRSVDTRGSETIELNL